MGRSQGELTPAKHRRAVAWTLIRPTITAIGLVTLYFLIPLDRRLDAFAWWGLIGSLIGVALLVAWQARAIAHSRLPRLRAFEALVTTLSLFLLLFATTYYLLAQAQPSTFNEPLTRVDALYFTMTVFTTVGFGDIVPVSQPTRIVTMFQMLGGALLIAVAARIFLSAIKVGLHRQSGNGSDRSED